jgi:hypothetical protein
MTNMLTHELASLKLSLEQKLKSTRRAAEESTGGQRTLLKEKTANELNRCSTRKWQYRYPTLWATQNIIRLYTVRKLTKKFKKRSSCHLMLVVGPSSRLICQLQTGWISCQLLESSRETSHLLNGCAAMVRMFERDILEESPNTTPAPQGPYYR